MTSIFVLLISLSSLLFKLMVRYLWRKGKFQLLPTSVANYFKIQVSFPVTFLRTVRSHNNLLLIAADFGYLG